MEEATPHRAMEEATPHRVVNMNDEKVVQESQAHRTKQRGTIDANGVENFTSSLMETKLDDTKECMQHDKAREPNKSDDISTTNTLCHENYHDSKVKLRENLGDTIQLASMTSESFATENKKLGTEHRSNETLDEKCRKHPGKKLEYVCNDHGEVICILCRDKQHSMCKSQGCISDLEDIYKVECNDYLDKSKKILDEIETILSDKRIEYGETKCSVEKCKSDIINNELQQCIKSNNDQLCKRLSEIESKIEREHSENFKILESKLSDINSLVRKINNSKSTASSVAAAFDGRRMLEECKKSLGCIKDKSKVILVFEKDPSVGQFLTTFNGIGDIKELTTDNEYDNAVENDDHSENFTLPTSSKSCNLLVMPDNRIIVSDETNGIIYCFGADGDNLFNTKDIKSPLGLCHMMWNVVVVVNCEGMTPLEVTNKEFSVKEKLSGDPFYAVSFGSGYFVGCGENTIHVMNCLGHKKKEIPNVAGRLCRPLFAEPKAISFDDESDIKFYVTDAAQRKVLCMTIDGKRLWGLSISQGSPGEITCRKYIFVLCRDARQILQIEKSGNLSAFYDTGCENPSGIFVDRNMTMYMVVTAKENNGRETTQIRKRDKNEWFSLNSCLTK